MKVLKLIVGLYCLCCLPLCLRTTAQVPGAESSPNSPLNDQKLGSVLVFPIYSSSVTNPQIENTRFAVTNTAETAVILRFFLTDGATGSFVDFFTCLAASRTASFPVNGLDPGVRGFILVVAVGADGKPVKHNHLTGEADIKLASSHRGSLKATAIAALVDNPGGTGSVALLAFNDASYNRLPRVVATNKLASQSDGNAPLLVLLNISGSYPGVSALGSLTGYLIGASGNTPPAFSLGPHTPQSVQVLSGTYPSADPNNNYPNLIPSHTTGWIKIWRTTDGGLLGAVLNYNPQLQSESYTSGHNLRALTLSNFNLINFQIIPYTC